MEQLEIVHKRKHDLYYIYILTYIGFGVIYILLTGTISENTVEFVFRDPVVYILGLFLVYTLAMLIANVIRNRQIVLAPQRIVFRTRFQERSIFHDHILRIVLKHERKKLNGGTFAVVRIRTTQRRRWIRIRVSNYERERDLYQEFKKLKHELKK
jgi:hypothetical protein